MRKSELKCALITGASHGLGRAIAWECASKGMNLFLTALPESGLPELCMEIAVRCGVSVEWCEGDLTDYSTHERIVDMIRSQRMEIDVLINNAGISPVGFFTDGGLACHETTIGLNVSATVRLTYLLIPELLARKNARILNVASLSAFFPIPYLPVYSATKSFILSLSSAMRAEFTGKIGVCVLCPNTIRVPGVVGDFIDRLGPHCRLACLSPEQIARVAVHGLIRNTPVIIPGMLNRILRAVAPLAPKNLVAFVAHRYWGEYRKIIGLDKKEQADVRPDYDLSAGRR